MYVQSSSSLSSILSRSMSRVSRMVCVGLLLWLFSLVGCGEVVVERCKGGYLLDDKCVACLKDEHCRSSQEPKSTKICSNEGKCVCGSDSDCPDRQYCGTEGGCFECLKDSHCTTEKPKCVQHFCQVCEPGQSKACMLPNVCGEGISICESRGEWSDCKVPDSGFCKEDEVCIDKKCTTCRASQPLLCGDVCVNIATDANHCGACQKACKPGQLCSGERCVCQPGQLLCDGKCIDPTNNPAHCGACGRACTSGQTCASGACLQTCPKSTPTPCYGGCVDTNRDANHCGKCGSKCSGRKRCVSGACRCPEGMTDCDGTCVDLEIDHQYCGSCSQACKRGQLCARGGCVTSCPASTPTTCYGGCVDLQNHPRHCGKCGKTCFDGQLCKAGKCGCPKGLILCGDKCVDIGESRLHCGGCGQACKDGESCYKGTCLSICPEKTLLCDGGCIEESSSFRHCGGCGKTCRVTEQCKAGKCICADGYTLCGDDCVDTQTSAVHCGACSNVCRVDEICRGGVCEPATSVCQAGQSKRCYSGAPGTEGVGVCKAGKQLCVNGKLSTTCTGEVVPLPEDCNGEDDNCDGQIDENLYCLELVAGDGTKGYKNGLGVQAQLSGPNGLLVLPSGVLLISDSGNHCLRKWDPTTKMISDFAGVCGKKGYLNGDATQALFNNPNALVVDTKGNVFVADVGNGSVRKVDPQGKVTTFAGSGTIGYENGTATEARFRSNYGLALGPNGALYVADAGNHVIRKIDAQGNVSLFAGKAKTAGYKNGPALQAEFASPSRLTFDTKGNLYISDARNRRIRMIDPQGNVTKFAGSGVDSHWNTTLENSHFSTPTSLRYTAKGHIYLADMGNREIRKLDPSSGVVTVAGNHKQTSGTFKAGAGATCFIGTVISITYDGKQTIYLASVSLHQIYKMTIW